MDEWVLISDRENSVVKDSIDIQDFCTIPYIETHLTADVTTLVEHSLNQIGTSPQPVLLVPEFHLAIANVINSGCISIVPSLLIDEDLLQFLKMQPPPFRIPSLHETLIWHSRNDAEPGHKWFRELILEIGEEIHHRLGARNSLPSKNQNRRRGI